MTAEDGGYRGLLIAELERQAGAHEGGLGELLPAFLADAVAGLPVAPATRRDVWGPGGCVDAGSVRDVLVRAEADLDSPWPLPVASQAARVHRDGNRDAWEAAAFARQHRLSRAALAAAVSLEDRWIDQVADGIQLLCEQSSWCWPAHDDAMTAKASVLADVTDPFLDLGAGEVAAQLAWIDHLLGEQLDARYPGLRQRVRHEVLTRVLLPFERRRDWHWLGLDGDVHNWNPWIHGNVLVAALQLMNHPDQQDHRLRVLGLVIEGLDRYVSALPADGAIDEGYAYWWNGACRALEALDLLSRVTGEVIDPTPAIDGLRETIAFPHRMHLGGHWYVNLADGQARPPADQPWHSLYRAAGRVGDVAARDHAVARHHAEGRILGEANGLGRLILALTDTGFLEAEPSASPLPRDVWQPSTQVLIARENAGSASGLAICAKGGHNAEHHNHNDVGSVMVTSDGVPVIIDAGRPTYERATFGPERYSIWTMQSSWHSVPEVRGVPQRDGLEFAASSVIEQIGTGRSSLSLDLTGAYRVPGLRSWRRSVALDRSSRCAVIEDVWDLESWAGEGAEPPTMLHFLLAGVVSLEEGCVHIAPLHGGPGVHLRWPLHVPVRLTERKLTDPMLSDVWGALITRLELDVTGCGSSAVTVTDDRDEERESR
jgi:hypothetical protein